MPESFLLDTSACIALTDKEAGADRVRELVLAAEARKINLHGCFVTLTEVQYIKTYDQDLPTAQHLIADLKALPIVWLHSDEALCAAAADIKASHKVSLADAFVVAAALRFDAVLVHKDPEFLGLPGSVKQEALPFKTTSAAAK